MAHSTCQQVKLVWSQKKGDLTFGLKKNSPYKLYLDNVLNKMIERGQIKRIFEKWEIKEPSCKPLIVSGDPLSLQKLISIFLIISIGLLLALAVLVFEMYAAKKSNNDEHDIDFLRLQMLMLEVNRHLDMKKRPKAGLLTIMQDTCEKIKRY